MLVLIDESGCPGFKIGEGSSEFFAVAMVIFEDFKQAELCSKKIEALAERLGIKPEFKFSKSKNEVRDEFFNVVRDSDFYIRAVVVDKSKIYSRNLRSNNEAFYNYFVKSLLSYDNDTLKNARVKLDGSASRKFKREMANYIKREVGGDKIFKFKMADSKSDYLIQLADMCVGAIARSYKPDRKHHDRWKNMIQVKIGDIWDFG